MTLEELQEAVRKGWTQEQYGIEFQGRNCVYKDFDHALKHVRKAAQKLENMTEEADHAGFIRTDGVEKLIADIVISAARLANVSPTPVILDYAVEHRVKEKILPKDGA